MHDQSHTSTYVCILLQEMRKYDLLTLLHLQGNTALDIGVLVGLLVGYRLIAFIILFIKARRSKA